jgi:hypothetical protein
MPDNPAKGRLVSEVIDEEHVRTLLQLRQSRGGERIRKVLRHQPALPLCTEREDEAMHATMSDVSDIQFGERLPQPYRAVDAVGVRRCAQRLESANDPACSALTAANLLQRAVGNACCPAG